MKLSWWLGDHKAPAWWHFITALIWFAVAYLAWYRFGYSWWVGFYAFWAGIRTEMFMHKITGGENGDKSHQR